MSTSLEQVRSRIEALGMNFQFKGTIKTSMNGIERETWLLEYEGSQFVFVAGQKNVTLGWDVNQCPLGGRLLEDLRKEFEEGRKYYQDELEALQNEYEEQITKAKGAENPDKVEELISERDEQLEDYEEERDEGGYSSWDDFMSKWNEHLSQCLSPLRTADIGDMLVELDSRFLEEDAPSLAQAVRSLKEGPFTLATEDEWEYLCNGGTRTLFRWGDTLNEVLTDIYQIGTDAGEERETPSLLNQPNMLGLYIAYNSYRNEIIDNTLYTKGGDGGCSLCGGDGPIYVLPCYTAFYRDKPSEYSHDYGLMNDYYCYRRIIRL